MPGFVEILREFVQAEIHGIYTVTFVRVEEVNEGRRAVVSLKSDSGILIDNVPIASPYARSGAGMITPVARGDEGFVLHAQEPLDDQIQERGEQPAGSDLRFQLEDAVLLPLVWLDEDDVPNHETGEFQVAIQEDGSVLRMLPDGRVRVEHASGKVIAMDADGSVTLGDEATAAAVLNADAELEYKDTQPDGSTSTKTVDVVDPGTSDVDAS
ncbi:Gp138 family membrane-puncturing spike protein [Halobacterium salinarum]|uniref:Gp138 family membrane-puncturing spike protein n=1 Tax=Halobacterium salinarum TaxID=2242 RepID=UPI0025564C69|nr:Gp138 family membrane-puncturing spike protein [Halobacterium salinarum]MDL0133531.1 Gp138 family membrane-puncturing spike protein [Halobacterium salinarum]